MRRIARRRLWGAVALVMLSLFVWGSHRALEVSLQRSALWSGWLLLLLVLVLALWNARKKLPFLPLGSALSWMELHVYAGLLAAFVFAVHLEFELPRGRFEVLLAALFGLVSVTGGIGLLLSRLLPGRLSERGEEVLFERIPNLRRQLREQAEALVLRSAQEAAAATIPDFYRERLAPFFAKPRNLAGHWIESRRPQRRLLQELRSLDRYASPRERELLAEIGELVKLKDDLDFQHANQLALKAWLIVHVPLSYSLILLAMLHVWVVYGFRGSSS